MMEWGEHGIKDEEDVLVCLREGATPSQMYEIFKERIAGLLVDAFDQVWAEFRAFEQADTTETVTGVDSKHLMDQIHKYVDGLKDRVLRLQAATAFAAGALAMMASRMEEGHAPLLSELDGLAVECAEAAGLIHPIVQPSLERVKKTREEKECQKPKKSET